MSTFIAIDFETATIRRDSACAVGFAAGYGGRVVLSRTYLIRPPSAQFAFTGLHGLRWEDVHDAPTFADLWPTLRGWIDHAAFVAAHNASFDRGVLHASCARYRLRPPKARFTCTVQLARSQWGIRPTKLPDVCRRLRIPLRHHEARSDAEACARIVLAAQVEGWPRVGAGSSVRSRFLRPSRPSQPVLAETLAAAAAGGHLVAGTGPDGAPGRTGAHGTIYQKQSPLAAGGSGALAEFG